MTVIAWDGQTLAADKRMVQGGVIARTVTKIMRAPDGCLVGLTGGLDVALEMRQWFLAGTVPADFPAKARDDTATMIVVYPNGHIWTWSSGPYGVRVETEKAAFGSGRDFAEAAMYLGKSAAEAVAVACVFQSDCGNGIDTLILEEAS